MKERSPKKVKPSLTDQPGVNQDDSDSSDSYKGTICDDVSWAELAFGQSCVNSQNGSDDGGVKAVKKKKKSTLYKRKRETFQNRQRRTTIGQNIKNKQFQHNNLAQTLDVGTDGQAEEDEVESNWIEGTE